jgi:hypothetical protein
MTVPDASLKPDPYRKGSYYRRIQDIERALRMFDVMRLPVTIQFVTYFFACEKLAHGVVGINRQRPAGMQYSHRTRLLLDEIKTAAATMNLSIPAGDLNCLFADYNEQHLLPPGVKTSARLLRNKLAHDFGPTNVGSVARDAPDLIAKMTTFLKCVNEVLAYQKANFAHVP